MPEALSTRLREMFAFSIGGLSPDKNSFSVHRLRCGLRRREIAESLETRIADMTQATASAPA